MKNIIQKLERFGISTIGHTHSTLLSHLEGTYEILKKWDSNQDVCLAGLCHSIYGTESFIKSPATLENRDYLRGVIGVESEILVYVFGAHKKESLWKNLERKDNFSLEDRFTNQIISLTKNDFSNLITITLANWLEQRPRAKAEFQLLRQREFIESKDYLCEIAYQDFLSAYSST